MKPKPDNDLLAIFARARRGDREDAPAWRPELLDQAPQRPSFAWRWALVTASVIVLGVFFTHMPPHETPLSEALPPLFDSPPGELFASVEPSLLTFEAPSDFLMPDQMNPTNP